MKPIPRWVSLSAILVVGMIVLAACGGGVAPATAPAAEAPAAAAPPAAAGEAPAGGPVLTDAPLGPGERPVQQVVYNSPEDYTAATGSTIAAYNEAPMLAELVAAGDLPPVAERLPARPVVVQPEEAIGKYGGSLRVPIEGENRPESIAWSYFTIDPLFIWSPTGEEMLPNLAERHEISEDGRTITLYLREGVKWSDGVPFTSADILFWWNQIVLNDVVSPSKPTILTRGGELPTVTAVDDLTVEFVFAEPYGLFVTYLGSWGGPRQDPTFSPAHYLQQFHTDFVSLEELKPLMEAEGFQEWLDFFTYMRDRHNPDLPTLAAWIPNQRPPQSVQTYSRNPYYWKVDTAGNQLPYMDELRAERMADTEAQLLKVIAGEFDFSGIGFAGGVPSLPLIMENAETAGLRLAYGTWMPNSFCNIMFNFTTPDEAKREIYNDVRFRRALSSAIDREELIRLVWRGAVFPSQVAPLYGPPYFGESELFQSFTKFDVELANQLLDEMGLTERDANGFRKALNGEDLLLIIYANTAWPPECPEVMGLITNYWEAVGINATVEPEAGQLWTTRHNANEHDMSARGAHFGGGPVHPTLNGNTFALGGWQWAPEWARWLDTNGEQGQEPPDDVKRIREIRELVLAEADEAARVELINEVFEIHMNNLWSIGLVVDDPRIYQQSIITNRVRNVPTWMRGEWHPNVPASWFINE